MVQKSETLIAFYEECHRRFVYDGNRLIYRYDIHSKQQKGGTPEKVSADGYLLVGVDYKIYLVHRLIYLMETGTLPELLDHIDRDKLNNRISNLRPADKELNSWNRGLQVNNTSGYRGVSWNKGVSKWHAYIKVRGKRIHLGFYNCPEEASAAYEQKRFEFRGDETTPP